LPTHTIDLTYVERGIHEELIAYVADQEGYLEDEGVHVALRDGTRWQTERLRAGATIGLGRAASPLAAIFRNKCIRFGGSRCPGLVAHSYLEGSYTETRLFAPGSGLY
jgi:hypothetical protein